ncbi:MAG: gliding motility protein GldN [Muribaculaceae bacterium]|jgi:gliding motility associated protien GldN|nr:gliding motility protein GldN [Muribaculaceae bacterium]MBO7164468.1 gliding motility protein GldN [Muribaculaceae bacterium]MBQ1185282.1 gliding motility protein GldN [Muribaculaceae bacterium]MBQ2371472.1 gliding motility protein GldN [Muribaculaceae bacterium]MBQ2398616.1 gliding motility protein GldN [Muribaculaceae bacterium]
MKTYRSLLVIVAALMVALSSVAQSEVSVRKRGERVKKKTEENAATQVTERMQSFYEQKEPHDADLAWMREIYRQIDLTQPDNAALYFPEDVIDGQENLFRLMLRLVINGEIPAYEYLDGREIFTDKYKINVRDMLDRFGIYYTEGKGSTEKNPKFVIEEADVPTTQVLNYYIIEKWEFDRRSNDMKMRVVAICPVLNRSSDFGGDARYPMFWVKFDALRPYLAQQYVFISDDNNLPQYSLDDYFNMEMYKGDIYKTKNLRNLSLVQMFPDPDDLKRAQDSIDNRLRNFDKNLWVPTREEFLAQKEKEAAAKEAAAKNDTVQIADRDAGVETVVVADVPAATEVKEEKKAEEPKARNKRSEKKKKTKAPKVSSKSGNPSAAKSVRRRKK